MCWFVQEANIWREFSHKMPHSCLLYKLNSACNSVDIYQPQYSTVQYSTEQYRVFTHLGAAVCKDVAIEDLGHKLAVLLVHEEQRTPLRLHTR